MGIFSRNHFAVAIQPTKEAISILCSCGQGIHVGINLMLGSLRFNIGCATIIRSIHRIAAMLRRFESGVIVVCFGDQLYTRDG